MIHRLEQAEDLLHQASPNMPAPANIPPPTIGPAEEKQETQTEDEGFFPLSSVLLYNAEQHTTTLPFIFLS